MAVIRKTITLRPNIWEMILKEAKLRDVNISRCIEDKFEFCQKHYAYPSEELDEISEQLDRDVACGKAKIYDNVEEMFKDLNI